MTDTIEQIRARHEVAEEDGGHEWCSVHGPAAHADRATLLRAIDEALAIARWQPIETAPLWQEVIVYQKSASPTKSNKNGVFTAVRVEKGWALTRFGPGYSHNPTHWMPLPTPPATKGTQDE